ncbi:MAG: 2,3-bisphosphoglycerate-independent phosphoglycerate mutase, partial [Chloroflexota bacterium]|nr:2,3-bisphosphoglycerate-independent phosphoglycerate mutase [Chloroflexota bacterium]
YTELQASGPAVGLPEGQMGNSEVGHLNIGAGYVVLQDMPRIDATIADGSFFTNAALIAAMENVRGTGGTLHCFGLFSPGGVHSHYNHLRALLRLARDQQVSDVAIHLFLDGRDTPPKSALGYVEEWEPELQQLGLGRFASVVGRYYAMDRDKRWERLQVAYDLLAHGEGRRASSAAEAISAGYAEGVTDEFMTPAVIVGAGGEPTLVQPGDSVVYYNFRTDRGRELTRAFVAEDFPYFDRGERIEPLHFTTFAEYDPRVPVSGVAFKAFDVPHPIAEVVAGAGLSQFHSAETEKYAHVTYFVNGGREEPYLLESRTLIPSPKVATYDLQPEMSGRAVAETVARRIQEEDDALVIVNFANPDMVGHTGVIPAAVAACETTDRCVRQVVEATTGKGGCALIIADHGNADVMLLPDGSPCTTHTTNPVPCILVGAREVKSLRGGGKLADVAPTLLHLMGLPAHPDMTGTTLVEDTR